MGELDYERIQGKRVSRIIESQTDLKGDYFSIDWEGKRRRKKKWNDIMSFLTIGYVVFIGDTARGLMFPTLWPLVSSMGGNEMTQGFTVAAFSFGRILSSPHFGKVSTSLGYRKVLALASSLMILGCFMYAKAWNCYTLIFSQMIIGVGSGTLGVTRAYVADNSSRKNRTVLMAKLTALQYAGFTVTPCIGGLLAWVIKARSFKLPLGLQLTEFTAPAFFMILLSFLSIPLLIFVFNDYVPDQTLKPSRSRVMLPSSSIDSNLKNYAITPGSCTPLSPNSSYSPLSTIGLSLTPGSLTPTSQQHESPYQNSGLIISPREPPFAEGAAALQGTVTTDQVSDKLWQSMVLWGLVMNVVTKGSVACFETLGTIVAIESFELKKSEAGFLFSFCGFLGVFALLMMQYLTKWFDDVKLVFYGCILMVVPAVVLYFDAGIWKLGLFISVFLMYSLGYPIGHTAVIGIFSKIVGARTNKQGGLLGWFGSAGSLARIIFPITCGVVSSLYGSNVVFLYVGLVLLISIVALLFLWKNINALSQ